MEASKVTVTPAKRGSRMADVLRFLHEGQRNNPLFLKDTSQLILCERYAMSKTDGVTPTSARQAFLKLIKRGIITKSKRYGNRRYDFRINYLHPGVPQYMLDEAPQSDKDYISRVNSRLQEKLDAGIKARLDSETETIISEGDEQEKTAEPEEAKAVEGKPTEGEKTTTPEPEPVVEPTPVIEPTTAPQPISVKREGNNLSLTININLNGIL